MFFPQCERCPFNSTLPHALTSSHEGLTRVGAFIISLFPLKPSFPPPRGLFAPSFSDFSCRGRIGPVPMRGEDPPPSLAPPQPGRSVQWNFNLPKSCACLRHFLRIENGVAQVAFPCLGGCVSFQAVRRGKCGSSALPPRYIPLTVLYAWAKHPVLTFGVRYIPLPNTWLNSTLSWCFFETNTDCSPSVAMEDLLPLQVLPVLVTPSPACRTSPRLPLSFFSFSFLCADLAGR